MQQYEGKRVRGPNGEMGTVQGGQIVLDTPAAPAPEGLRQVVPKAPAPQTAPQATRDQNAAAASAFDPVRAEADAANAQNKPTYDRFGAIDKLRDNIRQDKRILTYEAALPIFASALTSPSTPEADNLLVNAIAKIGDPATGVQQREGDAYEGAAPAIEQIKARLLKEFGSDGAGNFTPEGRHRMKVAMRNRMHALAQSYNGARAEWAKFIRESGIPGADPGTILGEHMGGRFQQAEADFVGRPITNLDGSQGAVPQQPYVQPLAEGLPSGPLEVQITDERLPGETDEEYRRRIDAGLTDRPPDISDTRPDSGGLLQSVDAGVRGVADTITFGAADEFAATMDTLFGRGGTPHDNLRRQRAVDQYDTQNNFGARLSGQLGGALLLGKIPAIGSARTPAQLARSGGAVGALYGFGSGDSEGGGVGNRSINALMGGAAGAGVGYGLGHVIPALGRGMGMAAGKVIGQPSPRQNALLQAGTEEGVPLNMSDVFPGSRNTVSTLETIPGAAGPVQRGIEAGREAIEGRVQQLGRGGTPREDMGSVVQEAGGRFVERANRQATRLYNRARNAAADTPIQPQSVMRVLSELVREEAATPGGTRAGAIIGRYAKAFEQGGSISIDGARKMRSELLSVLRDDGGLSKAAATRLTGKIMAGINDDIERSLTNAGKGRAVEYYRQADRYYAQSREEIERVTEKFVGTEARPKSAEETLSALQSAMGQRGNSEALHGMLRRLSPEERRDFAATLVEPLGRAGADEPFSPARFISSVRKISPASRSVIFGRDGEQSIMNLIRLSNAKKETVQSLNNSRSGQTANYRVVLSSVLFGLPGGGAFLSAGAGLNGATGVVGGAAIGGAGVLATRGIAKALMSEQLTRLLAQAPATTKQKAISAHIGRMRQLAARDPNVRSVVEAIETRLLEAVNDNFSTVTRSAASEGGANTQSKNQ